MNKTGNEPAAITPGPQPEPPPLTPDPQRFPIVGIGASAGGLAAFEAFFSGMPATGDPDMAFVLVQHLAPDHKSILTDLVRRYTRMTVSEVVDGVTVKPNCAYIIPPNRDMAFMNGTLQLLEPDAPRGQRLPINFFFRSLAQDLRDRAICIVLSGTGSDGTLGVRAIKAEGGMVMAQAPASTEYDGMPSSAIATGLVDYILPPAEMPAQLISYAAHAFGHPPRPAGGQLPKSENAMRKIFLLLRSQTGHDFSQYKPGTTHRRIERRMAVHQLESVDAYVKYLQQKPEEVDALFRDLLIGVTSFFRDPESFKMLEEQIIPKVFEGTPAGGTIRVWVPGCSTGEEAYSIAILLAEHQESIKQNFKIQVFATDIDSNAIATARAGLYAASIATDITPERLARYFTSESNGSAYRIHKSIRDSLIFSEQNVIKDPPFTKLALISCRNLMIYFGAELQKKLIPLFHYALSPNGFLFLGTSETVGENEDQFDTLDRKWKVYQRKELALGAQRLAIGRHLPLRAELEPRLSQSAGVPALPAKPSLRELTEQAILQQLGPAAALVNAQGDILYLHGRTGSYLEPAPGEAGISNILKMARQGLRQELTTALHKSVGAREIVAVAGLRVKTNSHFTLVDLTIRPLPGDPAASPANLYLVLLQAAPVQEESPALPAGAAVDGPGAEPNPQLDKLKQELQAKEDYLQATIEEIETSNEELKSSNEEMQSVNEELQSTNEELETSKEELQSVNEELGTVNNELQNKVADLSRANNDMNNLLAGTGIATVFVDSQLRILRFTPSATRVINLIPSDVGRPVGHIVSNLVSYDGLTADVQGVLASLIPKQVDVRAQSGEWYLMRIAPYRTMENVIEGVVINFVDISAFKKVNQELRITKAMLQAAMDQSQAGIIIADGPDGVLRYVNAAAIQLRGSSAVPGTGIGQYFRDWQLADLDGTPLPVNEVPLAHALKSNETSSREFVIRDTSGESRTVLANAAPILDHEGKVTAAVMVFMDITGRKQDEELRRQAKHVLHLAAVVRDAHDAITVQDLEGRILGWNPEAVKLYGWSEQEALGMNIRDIIPQPQREEALSVVRQLSQAAILKPYRAQRVTKDGRIVEVTLTATALANDANEIYAIATTERVAPGVDNAGETKQPR